MPLLTNRIQNLRQIGPVLEVVFAVPQPIAEKLRAENKPIPIIKVLALIDTGASHTSINQTIVDTLGLLPGDVQTFYTANGPADQLLYDLGIVLPISAPNIISVQAPCADLDGQPFQALIGRDVLGMCTLFYNGPDNSYTLHF